MALSREITTKITDLLKEHPQGLSITGLVKNAGINRNTAGRYLEALLMSGQVEMRRFGMAKIFTLSRRLPVSSVLSISSEYILQLDGSQRIIFINDPFLGLLGAAGKDLLGKNIEYTVFPLFFEEVCTALVTRLKDGISGTGWRGELSLPAKGISFFCRIIPTVFNERSSGISVFFEDITERKRAEEALKESEQQFRLLAENSLDMIGRTSPDGRRTYVSPACRTILGYEPEELIGNKGRDLIHPDDTHMLADFRNKLKPGNAADTVTLRLQHKRGHFIWIESVIRAVFDQKSGELSEFYTVTRDITERKRAEDALKESEDRYRTLVEISPDAVIIHRDGKIIFMNPAAIRLLGALHPDELTGKDLLDFILPDFRDALRTTIEKDLGGHITPPMALAMVRIDGTTVMVEGRGVRTFIGGNPAVQVALRDITGRKPAEKAMGGSGATASAHVNTPADPVV